MSLTADALVANVRRIAQLPAAASEGTLDPDILAQAQVELEDNLFPLAIRVREEYGVVWEDVVSDVNGYVRLPRRCFAGRVRDASMLPSGNLVPVPLQRLNPPQADVAPMGSVSGAGVPWAFYPQSGYLKLVPTPQSPVTVRVKFYLAPPTLQLVASSGVVTGAVDSAGTTVVNFTPGPVLGIGTRVDCFYADNGDALFWSERNTVVNSGQATFPTAALPAWWSAAQLYTDGLVSPAPTSRAAYLSLEGFTSVPPLPDVMHMLLAQRTACRVLQQLGDGAGLEKAEVAAAKMEASVLATLTPRTEAQTLKVRSTLAWRNRGRLGYRP